MRKTKVSILFPHWKPGYKKYTVFNSISKQVLHQTSTIKELLEWIEENNNWLTLSA